jgi:hypothetical protein
MKESIMGTGTQSGSGTRPSTDGTIDNMGAGEAFLPGSPDSSAPAPRERMSEKRADAQSVEDDDSAPFGLTESAKSIRKDDSRDDQAEMSDQDR